MTKLRVSATTPWDIDKHVTVSNYPDDPENVYLEMDTPSDKHVFSWQTHDFYAPKWEPHGNKSTAMLPYSPDMLMDLEKEGYTLDLTSFDKNITEIE